jgi:photosystem II stability/assembly factor-like uncharacterized protein
VCPAVLGDRKGIEWETGTLAWNVRLQRHRMEARAMRARSFIATARGGIARAESGPEGEWLVEHLLPDLDVRCLAADPLEPRIVYAGTQGDGLYRSEDAGRRWRRAGLDGRIVKSVAASRLEPGTLYAGIKPPGIFVSRDGGGSWEELTSFEEIPARSSWWSPAEPPGTPYVQGLALSPTDPNRLVAGIEFGAVLHSGDGGRSWRESPGALPDCHTLTFHHSDGNRVYEGGSSGAGAAISRDAGATWHQPEEGLGRHYGWAVAADPASPDTWYISISTGPERAHSGSNAQAAIYRRRDDEAWRRLSGGLPDPIDHMPYALLTDPSAPGHLYAGLSNGDVWHSTDQGDSWQRLPFSLGGIHRSLIMV